jgi:predicted GNAT superfamily acetyltransferase
MELRDLHTLDDFSRAVDLQRRVWGSGYDDIVPVSIFAVVVKRGGILVGAFEKNALAGFVFSMPGIKNGRVMQWSHMLGVDEPFRRTGLGHKLKLSQRERTLAQGLDLIEWTFDPLQAANAHLNFARLGVVAEEYLENVYGDSGSVLHRGAPTDRFVVSWKIATPHVVRRIQRDQHPNQKLGVVKDAALDDVPVVNHTKVQADWRVFDGPPLLDCTDRRLFVEIPTTFGDMLQHAPERALEWRTRTRDIFTTYFSRGYRCIDFLLDKDKGFGRYLLERAGVR